MNQINQINNLLIYLFNSIGYSSGPKDLTKDHSPI